MSMNILVIGGGGREHALAWKLARSARAGRVFVAPGNAGTAREPRVENVAIPATDVRALLEFAEREAVGLTVVGPEAPLVQGVADQFAERGLRCFGPSQSAARLEGSKAFAKAFLERHGIPTADYRCFDSLAVAESWLEHAPLPTVIKADGLAAGKGVTIARTREQARAALHACLDGDRFGKAGRQVVVEEYLVGEEASFICIVAGGRVLPLASSQDHKARDDGGLGPNTGGMGACSPAPVVTPELHRRVMAQVIEPTVSGLASEGIDYLGFLYAGLMVGADGRLRVLEYNCRLGDPETQPIVMRLESDLLALCEAAVDRRLGSVEASWRPESALGVVMAAGGYPHRYARGSPIDGLAGLDSPELKIFHAGTRDQDGQVVTDGGRVLCVTALGESVGDARARAYHAVDTIHWPGAFHRRDIGLRTVAHGTAPLVDR